VYDDDVADNDVPELSTADADEVIALVRTALGGRVTKESPVDGDLDMIMAGLTRHPNTITKHSVWLTDSLLNVSLCPDCGSVTISVFAPMLGVVHGCIEVMEQLRQSSGLGGDPDHLTCTYQRIPVNADGVREHLYIFSGVYWLDFDDVEDKVIHATRSLVRVLDEISEILLASTERQSRNN
jgi:hypothetical protein